VAAVVLTIDRARTSQQDACAPTSPSKQCYLLEAEVFSEAKLDTVGVKAWMDGPLLPDN